MRQLWLIAAVAAMAGSTAVAGWTSSGGEVIKDAQNPWFIQNTPVVKACIATDATVFHLPAGKDLQHDFVEPVLAYWAHEFSSQPDGPENISGYPKIATQRFEISACDSEMGATADVRLQFGVLTPDQIVEFARNGQDPRDFVSAAIRTDYDRVNLRAKGFIYIAPDSGAYRPRASGMAAMPWAIGTGGTLTYVLAHEFGHVFGLPHSSTGSVDNPFADFMTATFPEGAVRLEAASALGSRDWIDTFFGDTARLSFGWCDAQGFSAKTALFFSAPTRLECIGIEGVAPILTVKAGAMADIPNWDVLGTVSADSAVSRLLELTRVNVWLPPEQTVVKVPSPYLTTLPAGPARSVFERSGTYYPQSGGLERSIWISSTPGSRTFRVGGVMDGRVVLDIMNP